MGRFENKIEEEIMTCDERILRQRNIEMLEQIIDLVKKREIPTMENNRVFFCWYN